VQSEAALEDVVQPESIQMQIKVFLDEIKTLGHVVGRPTQVMQRK
jgi:hypothetical protein